MFAVRKVRGQIAVILNRRRILAPQQVRIAAVVERLGQPRTLREARLHFRHDAPLFVQIVAVAGHFHQQIKPPRAVIVRRVGQCFGLGRAQQLQLQVAGRRGHGKARAAGFVEACMARQRAVLLACLLVMAGVVVSVAQAAQLRDGQAALRAHGGEFCPCNLRLGGQRMSQQQPLEEALRLLLQPQRECRLGLRKLIAGTVGGLGSGGGGEHAFGTGRVLHRQQRVGFQLRRLGIKNALRIAFRKALQQRFGCLLIAHLVVGARVQKIGVVGQLRARLPSQAKIFNRLAVALVQQVGVAQRQVGRRRRLARMVLRIAGHARISRRRAQRGQLLGHGAEFGGGHKGQLDPRRVRSPRRFDLGAYGLFGSLASFARWLRGLLRLRAGGLGGRISNLLLHRRRRLLGCLLDWLFGRRRRLLGCFLDWLLRWGGSNVGRSGCRAARGLPRKRQHHQQHEKQNSKAAGSQPRNESGGRRDAHLFTLSCFRALRGKREPLALPHKAQSGTDPLLRRLQNRRFRIWPLAPPSITLVYSDPNANAA